jgi:DNA invertase Pin-like site-specific DNA recombinase
MKAIGYIRLSRKDQSKYSLSGQESAIKGASQKKESPPFLFRLIRNRVHSTL